MKKYIGMICLSVLLSTSALAESCAGGSGTVITGLDGTRYCQSNTNVNWWSAFAWCDAIGGRLIDVTEECIKTTGTSGCPNLTGVGKGTVWTQNVSSANSAYYVILSSGAVYYSGRAGYNAALCVGF